METKEAIKWVFDIWHEWENVYVPISAEKSLEEGKKMDEVIELLKRGEKYKAMWREFKKKYNVDYNLIELGYLDINYANQKDLDIIMEDLEQKYFPPKPSDNFTEKVMEKINKEADHDETEIQ